MDCLKYHETENKGFWTILRGDITKTDQKNSAWSIYGFHFELLFQKKPFEDVETISIEAHVDHWPDSIKTAKNKKLTKEFENKGFKFNPHDANGLLYKNDLPYQEIKKADFSDFSTSIDTIKRILDVLQSEKFQECQKIADNFKL